MSFQQKKLGLLKIKFELKLNSQLYKTWQQHLTGEVFGLGHWFK